MKVAVILGTRPEIIKMSPVIKELENAGIEFFITHTGQHYAYNMDKVFFEQLNLHSAKYNLEAGSGSHGEQTARILSGIEKVLLKEQPDITLVQGDTNTALAGALAASKLGIVIGHIEAGLRSGDRHMPEEINRILADHCSDYLFAPTETSRSLLTHEGISPDKIFITGNTIVDALYRNIQIAESQENPLKLLNLQPHQYFLVTVHRQENVDYPRRLAPIILALDKIASYYALPVVYPIHPRSLKRLRDYNLMPSRLCLTNPLDYFSFLILEKNARLILTDSGGVQEESCILGVPCVTLRENTERPETLDVGANMLAGTVPERIYSAVETMLNRKNGWHNPFGDGTASHKIVNIICRQFTAVA